MTFRHYISGARKTFRSQGLQQPEVGGRLIRSSGSLLVPFLAASQGDPDPSKQICFGGNPDDPAAGFLCHMRQLADELRAETGEERRISGDEDNPVTGNPVEEAAMEVEGESEAGNQEEEEDEAADEDEDEDEEEDPGYGNSRDDDDDSPPVSLHRPVTRSTPKKQPVSRPKRKAYRNKSGPGSSSRKRTWRR